jgi:transposase
MNAPTQKRDEHDEQRRMRAAVLFREGLSNAEIGRRLHVSRQSVSGWCQLWKQNGEAGLKVRMPGRCSQLSEEQRQQIVQALLQGPQAHGFQTPLWTLARIAELIARLTGVRYHPGHVWYLLKELGWSCQEPEAQAKERDQAEIERWLSKDWPRIKRGP